MAADWEGRENCASSGYAALEAASSTRTGALLLYAAAVLGFAA
jgi:hypothetical protein